MSFATDLMADARNYVAQQFGLEASEVPDEAVEPGIEHFYPGGWDAYKVDFTRWAARFAPKVEELSPIKKRAIVVNFTRRRLSEFDDILSFEAGDLEMKFVVSRATVDRRSRRDVVTTRTLELWRFRRDAVTAMWGKGDCVEASEAVDEAFVRWGIINDPERDEVKRDQYETCYRPGTSNSPMQGYCARLEISHKDAYPELYPSKDNDA